MFFLLFFGKGETKGVKVSSPFGPKKKKKKKTVGVFFFFTRLFIYIYSDACVSTRVKKSKRKRERERTNTYIYTHIYIVMTRAGVLRGLLYGVLIQNYARVGVLPRRDVSFSFPFFSFLSFFLSFFL